MKCTCTYIYYIFCILSIEECTDSSVEHLDIHKRGKNPGRPGIVSIRLRGHHTNRRGGEMVEGQQEDLDWSQPHTYAVYAVYNLQQSHSGIIGEKKRFAQMLGVYALLFLPDSLSTQTPGTQIKSSLTQQAHSHSGIKIYKHTNHARDESFLWAHAKLSTLQRVSWWGV